MDGVAFGTRKSKITFRAKSTTKYRYTLFPITSPHILWNHERPCEVRRTQLLTYYLDRQFGPVVRARGDVLNLAQGEHTIDDSAKHDVLPVKEVAFRRGDEELATIRVGSRVGLESTI